MSGYNIVDFLEISDNITFIRINPTNIKLTLRDIFITISEKSWINNFDKDYIRESFNTRADATINYIYDNIIKDSDDNVTADSGEYIISELARSTIVSKMGYLDIPLGDIIKEKVVSNPGFDFFTESPETNVLFGEAKYVATSNAYGKAFKQITNFINNKKDIADLLCIDKFCSQKSLQRAINGNKGYIAAFASKDTSTDRLLSGIKNNKDFVNLSNFEELICVAVNI